MFEKIKNIVALAKRDAETFMADKLGQANITGLAMAIFVLVVIGYVSIYVVNEIHGIAGITSGSVFHTASTKVISVMNTSWGKFFRAHKSHVQKSDSRGSYECLNSQNDAHRRDRSISGRDHSSDKRRIRRRRRWRNYVDNMYSSDRWRGFSSPTTIFST